MSPLSRLTRDRRETPQEEDGSTVAGEAGADDSYNDMLESELSGEVENGRLVRLMIKLGFINERAE